MKKRKHPPLCATQSSEVADVFLAYRRWHYSVRGYWSEEFRSSDEAVRTAFDRGFGAVKLDGKVIIRRT